MSMRLLFACNTEHSFVCLFNTKMQRADLIPSPISLEILFRYQFARRTHVLDQSANLGISKAMSRRDNNHCIRLLSLACDCPGIYQNQAH